MTTTQSVTSPSVVVPPGVWYKRLYTYLWYDVILLLYIGINAFFKEVSTKAPVLPMEELRGKNDHVCVITGGPRGIALGLIKRLSQMGFTIIMGVRNVEDSQRRLDNFANSNTDLNLKVKFFPMDLHSLSSMKKFADSVLAQTPRIDLLLCNGAVMRDPYRLTEDGYESQFVANYLSQFLLTQLLLERLKETGKMKGSSCQVIYTSSIVYQCGSVNFEELEKCNIFTTTKFYYASKLYPVMSMLTLERIVEESGAEVHFYCVHPGLIPTELWHDGMGSFFGWLGQQAKKLFRTIENGADTVLWPAFAKEYQDRGGLYFESGKPITISNQARNEENQTKLYERSMELIQKFLK